MKTLIFILFSIPFFACALPSQKQVTSIYWEPPTTYETGDPIPSGIQITYFVYWRSPGGQFDDAQRQRVDTPEAQFSGLQLPDGVYEYTVTAGEVIASGDPIESDFTSPVKARVDGGNTYLIRLSPAGNLGVR